MSARREATYSAGRIASRVAALGKEISRKCGGRLLDVLVTLDRGGVALEPDYFDFRTVSVRVCVGYGLAAPNGTGRNLRELSSGTNNISRKSGKRRKKKA